MPTSKRTLDLSVVIPVYHGGAMLAVLHERLSAELKRRGQYEIIFVDDGSTDKSFHVIQELAKRDKRVVGVRLSRNFGQHNATLAGLAQARGNIALTMDQDLQNPPEEIGKLLGTLDKGFDVVYGLAETRGHTAYRNISSDFSKWISSQILSTALAGNFSSFRAIRKWVVDEIVQYRSRYTFIDGLISWTTSNVGGVPVRNDHPEFGSQYTMRRLITHGLNLLVNFSIRPLQFASLVGTVSACLGIVAAFLIVLDKLIYNVPVQGWASLMVAVLVMSGAQLIFLGLIGEYVGRILMNANRSPNYVIREVVRGGIASSHER